MNQQNRLQILGNGFGLIVICIILTLVFVDQLLNYDLPCPLCLLQRVCYIAIGLCILMNFRFGFRPSHYGLMILVTLLGMAIAVRQIFLHYVPNDPGYGALFLGRHLYNWSAIGFLIIMMVIAVALIFEDSFDSEYKIKSKWFSVLASYFLFLILINTISTFLECGPHICPANPTQYYLLDPNK